MGDGWYVLDEQHNVVPVTVMEYSRWLKEETFAAKVVAKTKVADAEVSTVFLGLDHAWDGSVPIVFETLVFGGVLDGEMERYATWDAAVAGHKVMVQRVSATVFP